MKTISTKLVMASAIAVLYAAPMSAQWLTNLNTIPAAGTNSIGTTALSDPSRKAVNVNTDGINRVIFDGTSFNTFFGGNAAPSRVWITTDQPGTGYVWGAKSNLGLYGSPGCVPTGTAGTDIYQAARNIFMQPPTDVTGFAGASNIGRVFIGVTPFVPSGPQLPKLLVRGGGSVATLGCGTNPNPDNIGLVSQGNFGEPVTSAALNKWLSLGSRPSAVIGFNSYGMRAQWNNYAVDLTVLEQAAGSIKDAALTWQDGTTTLAPNTVGYNSNNGLLIQFRNGNIPSGVAANDRFTVAKYSINNGTGLLQINGNLSTGVVLSPSDARLKKDIITFNNSMEIINRLNPVTYNYKAEEFGEMGLPTYKQYGFIAQEMEKVLPTHVVDLNNGYKSVNYVMLIPILTKAMQEMNTTVSALKEELTAVKKENSDLQNELERKGVISPTDGSSDLRNQFFQNKPNPFNDVTTISYAFKKDEAYKILVTDLSGKKVKEYTNLTGSGDLQISKNDLPAAGIYLYSLVTAGGDIVATKQMIFEK